MAILILHSALTLVPTSSMAIPSRPTEVNDMGVRGGEAADDSEGCALCINAGTYIQHGDPITSQ